MSKGMMMTMVVAGALIGPAAMAQSRPTSTHAVGTDGSVYYVDRTAGTVIRVSADGSSDLVANQLDSPTGVQLESSTVLLVGDEVGVHRVFLNRGTIRLIRALPTDFEPRVEFEQDQWVYREQKGRITVAFEHNLQESAATFDLEVSQDGGQSWTLAASGLRRTRYTWIRPQEDQDSSALPLAGVRFRVKALVDGEVKCSDVSDYFDSPTARRAGGQ